MGRCPGAAQCGARCARAFLMINLLTGMAWVFCLLLFGDGFCLSRPRLGLCTAHTPLPRPSCSAGSRLWQSLPSIPGSTISSSSTSSSAAQFFASKPTRRRRVCIPPYHIPKKNVRILTFGHSFCTLYPTSTLHPGMLPNGAVYPGHSTPALL